MVAASSVYGITGRWPLVIFYTMTNIAGLINVYYFYLILFLKSQTEETLFWVDFHNPLCKSFLYPELKFRVYLEMCWLSLICIIQVKNLGEETSNKFISPQERSLCYMGGRKKKSSSTMKCNKCIKFVCKQHWKTKSYACHVK